MHHFDKAIGVSYLQKPLYQVALLGLAAFMGLVIGVMGTKLGMAVALLPAAALVMLLILAYPLSGLWLALGLSFVAAGLTRYVPLPWGLMVDTLLAVALLGWLLGRLVHRDFHLSNNDALRFSLLWFVYVVFELLNPEHTGITPWFYAMRALGFYTLLGFVMAFTYLRHPRYVGVFLHVVFGMSALGALWGLRQQFFGTDAAEDYWLYVEGHHDEHVLHGVLRVFSFYSDAGQFGAAQIMVTLMAGILILGPFGWKRKLAYGLVAALTLLGFLYSGARGALAVPFAGGILYMVLSKNFKILTAGMLALVLGFCVLKYTYILQSFQPVARMRTALAPDNPSLLARLRNQATLGDYLATRPLGGGVGSAGYWGERFTPGTLLAQTPTDSYYVRIWAETGIIGLALHLLMLGYFLGKGSAIVWHLRNAVLRTQVLAIMAAFAGVLLANYGNQVFLQFPTGIIMAIGLPLVFLAPEYDDYLTQNHPET